jgi:guanylate kinase
LEAEPDLTVLILRSRSLAKNEEKQNWFNLIPMMNQEQIEKLRDILTRERDKIAEIEARYEQKKQEIRAKYQMKFDAANYNDKVAQIRSNEQNVVEQDSKEADDLLNNL